MLDDRQGLPGVGSPQLEHNADVSEIACTASTRRNHGQLVVGPGASVGEVARRMTEADLPAAVVRIGDGCFGLVTDALLRARVLVAGRPASTPAGEVMGTAPPTVVLGDSAAEALMLMLDRDAEFLLVTDREGELRGVVAPRDFAISPSAAGVSLHEQLRRARTVDELVAGAAAVPAMLGDLLSRGLASGKVIAVYSAFLDTIIRRAIGLVFAQHPELSVDAFTWLSLGSNGRREAVLSSDVDSAVAFDDAVPAEAIAAYRAAFGEVYEVLARAGLSGDDHGATAQHALFARTNADWRAAGEQWLAAPAEHNGAMMTSLLVDGRPIHGDPGLPAVTRVFGDLRGHPGTMRLLLRESLARRAKLRRPRHPRPAAGDLRHQGARAAAGGQPRPLGRAERRLGRAADHRAAAGGRRIGHAARRAGAHPDRGVRGAAAAAAALPAAAAPGGWRPSDVLVMDRVSPIDRSVIAQAVREIAAAQRRMDNVSHYVDAEDWTSPEPALIRPRCSAGGSGAQALPGVGGSGMV